MGIAKACTEASCSPIVSAMRPPTGQQSVVALAPVTWADTTACPICTVTNSPVLDGLVVLITPYNRTFPDGTGGCETTGREGLANAPVDTMRIARGSIITMTRSPTCAGALFPPRIRLASNVTCSPSTLMVVGPETHKSFSGRADNTIRPSHRVHRFLISGTSGDTRYMDSRGISTINHCPNVNTAVSMDRGSLLTFSFNVFPTRSFSVKPCNPFCIQITCPMSRFDLRGQQRAFAPSVASNSHNPSFIIRILFGRVPRRNIMNNEVEHNWAFHSPCPLF